MDTKNSVATNIKETSSSDRAASVDAAKAPNVDVPNSNIVEGGAGGSDVKTIDMSGTNIPDATNAKTASERAKDLNDIDPAVVDTSVPNPHAVRDTNNANDVAKKEAGAREAHRRENTVKVRLTKPHTHEGIEYDKGDFVEVDESSAKYIVETADAGVKV